MAGQFTELLQSRDIIALMLRGLDAPPAPWFEMLTNKVVSDKDSEQYVWLGSAPVMREFLGGRKPATLNKNSFRVENKKFEASLEIPTEWFDRDHTGQIRMKVAELVDRARQHRINLLSDLIVAASSTLCYDGQYFFDTDHAEGDSGSQSNINGENITTPASPTPAEMEEAILSSVEQMMGLKDDKGELTNGSARSFLVVVPLNMMKALATTLKSEIILESGAARNSNMRAVSSMMGMTFEGIVNPRSSATTKLHIFRTDAAIKPFVYQVEKDINASAIAEGSEHAWKNLTYMFGVDASYNVGLNQWRGAIEVQFS